MLIGLFVAALSMQEIKRPSFDCTAALEPVELAICSDAELARLDVRMADRYVDVRRGLSANGRRALETDQRWFLGARDAWFENRDRWAEFPDLAGRMNDRIDLFDSLDTQPSSSLIGRWRNVSGEVQVTALERRDVRVAINAVDPVNARWICDTSFTGPLEGRTVEGVADGDDTYRLRAELKDGVLQVEEIREGGATSAPGYCGHNGHVSGPFFRVR